MIHVAKTSTVKEATASILLPVFQTATGDRWLEICIPVLLRHPESTTIPEKKKSQITAILSKVSRATPGVLLLSSDNKFVK